MANASQFKTKETFVAQARAIWGDRYDYTDSVYIGGKEPITIYCPKHGYHFRLPMAQNHTLKGRSVGCPVCKYESRYNMEFGADWRKFLKLSPKNNRVGRISSLSYYGLTQEEIASRKAERMAERKAEAERRRAEKKAQRRAAYEEKRRLQHEETMRRREEKKAKLKRQAVLREKQRIKDLHKMFRREAPKAQGKGYKYKGIGKITSRRDTVLVHCPNPEHEWHPMRVFLILQGCKCRECARRHESLEKRCQDFINNALAKHGPKHYDYSKVPETYVNNDTPVMIRCKIHDLWFRTTPDNNLHTANGSCPKCAIELAESDGERAIRLWLEQHHIRHERGVNIPNENPRCKRAFLVPDFWLPDHNMFIEYNGMQHYEVVNQFHNDEWTLEDQQIRDQTLRDYCNNKRHPHRLLEIAYWDFDRIDEILEAEFHQCKQPTTISPNNTNHL